MYFSKNTYFTFFLIGILLGISINNITTDLRLSLLIYGVFFLFTVLWGLYYHRIMLLCLLLLSSLFLGSLYSHVTLWSIHEKWEIVDRYTGLYASFVWEVQKLHKRSDYYDEYILELSQIENQEVTREIHHILRIPKNFSLHPGEYISYSGKVYEIEDFNGFSYKNYMISAGIYFSTSSNTFERLSGSSSDFKKRVYDIREHLLERIASIFPSEEAIFLWGILFGARENIPKDLREDFNNSWLTHFIAVSGFNITLCVIFTTFVFWFLPLGWRIIAVSSVIVGFSIFVGLGAPVVRAAIMGVVGYIFLQSGNTTKNITLLAFTAVCMAIYSPLSLNYDVSLHLSFLAVIGIMYTQEFFMNLFRWIPSTFAIREAFVLTLAALSFSLPIMIFQFGQVSLFAPFANIAVTWTIPLAMIWGALILIVDSISPLLAQYIGFVEWILLAYDIMMVRFFWNLEFALIQFDFWLYKIYGQLLYFIILIYVVSYFHLEKKKQP